MQHAAVSRLKRAFDVQTNPIQPHPYRQAPGFITLLFWGVFPSFWHGVYTWFHKYEKDAITEKTPRRN